MTQDAFTSVGSPGGWVGRSARNLPEDFFAGFIRDPERFFEVPSAQILKRDRKTTVVRVRLSGRDLVIKRFNSRGPLRRLGFLFSPSPAARSLDGALLLRGKGFSTAAPLAAFERRNWSELGKSYYIAEEVQGGRSLRDLWRVALPALALRERRGLARSILGDLARLLSDLHRAGIYHRDLKASNILAREWSSERRQLVLIDLDRVRASRRVPFSKRLNNLVQVRLPCSEREKIYFFARYAALCCASRAEAKTLVRRAVALRRKEIRRRDQARPSS